MTNKEARSLMRAEIAQRRQDHGISIIHMPRISAGGKGGLTIAYRPTKDWDRCRIVEVSTAICHCNDSYDKAVGAYGATASFIRGERIRVRVPRDVNKVEALQTMFSTSVIDSFEEAGL